MVCTSGIQDENGCRICHGRLLLEDIAIQLRLLIHVLALRHWSKVEVVYNCTMLWSNPSTLALSITLTYGMLSLVVTKPPRLSTLAALKIVSQHWEGTHSPWLWIKLRECTDRLLQLGNSLPVQNKLQRGQWAWRWTKEYHLFVSRRWCSFCNFICNSAQDISADKDMWWLRLWSLEGWNMLDH